MEIIEYFGSAGLLQNSRCDYGCDSRSEQSNPRFETIMSYSRDNMVAQHGETLSRAAQALGDGTVSNRAWKVGSGDALYKTLHRRDTGNHVPILDIPGR